MVSSQWRFFLIWKISLLVNCSFFCFLIYIFFLCSPRCLLKFCILLAASDFIKANMTCQDCNYHKNDGQIPTLQKLCIFSQLCCSYLGYSVLIKVGLLRVLCSVAGECIITNNTEAKTCLVSKLILIALAAEVLISITRKFQEKHKMLANMSADS